MMLQYFQGKQEVYEARYKVDDWPLTGGTLTRTELQPGRSTRGHEHAHAELYFVEAGRGILEYRLAGSQQPESIDLFPGKMVEIAPHSFHRVFSAEGIVFWGIFMGEREGMKK